MAKDPVNRVSGLVYSTAVLFSRGTDDNLNLNKTSYQRQLDDNSDIKICTKAVRALVTRGLQEPSYSGRL